MPYVTQENRDKLDHSIEQLSEDIRRCGADGIEGNSNYALTRVLMNTFFPTGAFSYRGFNRIMGVLTCVSLEMYRRMVAPYEDQSIVKNGDVPEYRGIM